MIKDKAKKQKARARGLMTLYKRSYEQQTFSSNGLVFDVSLIWDQASDKTPKKIKVSRLKKYYKQKSWSGDGIKISINDVLNNPEKYIEHYKRLEGVLLDHPIIIWKEEFLDGDKKEIDYHIADGLHRLAKCKLKKLNIMSTEDSLKGKSSSS